MRSILDPNRTKRRLAASSLAVDEGKVRIKEKKGNGDRKERTEGIKVWEGNEGEAAHPQMFQKLALT